MECPLCAELVHSSVLKRCDNFSIVFNNYPYAPGHVMIITNDHISGLTEMSADVRAELIELLCETEQTVCQTLGVESANIGWNHGPHSGASIPGHFHVHIVPRHVNDFGFFNVINRTIPMRDYSFVEKIRRAFTKTE